MPSKCTVKTEGTFHTQHNMKKIERELCDSDYSEDEE